jgi:alpha-dioxygenase
MSPDPVVVATKLLARKEYKDTGKQFNILAAAWIQFMVHDWIDHLEDTQQVHDFNSLLINNYTFQ